MYTTWDIYCTFRKVQAQYAGRGYRLPKDWEKFLNEKLNVTSRENLQKLTDYFNTKWYNISPEKYFEAGFDLYKNFTYKDFFDKKIIKTYISNDKDKKRELNISKQGIINSIKHVYYLLSDEDTESIYNMGFLRYYARMSFDGYMRQPIKDYLDNKITSLFLVWLINKGYIRLTEEERSILPYIVENYRTLKFRIEEIQKFLYSVEEKIW